MRVAANGVMLVSQPRATMASFTPETAASDAKPGSEASNSAPVADATHTTTPNANGPTDQSSAQIVSGAAKNSIPATPATTLPASDKPANTPASPTADTSAAAASAAALPQPAASTNAPPGAPTPTAAATNLPVLPQTVGAQVAVTLNQALKIGDNHIQIQLQPADLGAVDVKLNINHDGRVTMVVSADRSDTLNLLKQDSSNLTQALRDAGLQADSGSLSFNLRGGYQFNQQQQQSSYGASAPTSAYAGRFADDTGSVAVSPPTTRSHAGSLDIHV